MAITLALACRDEAPLAPVSPVVDAVASIVVTAPRQALAPGDSIQLTAQAFDAQGRVLPTATIVWASGAAAIVSIDSRGLATAVAEGTAAITATSEGHADTLDFVVSVTQLCACTRIIDSTATALVQRNDSTGRYVFRLMSAQQPAIDSGNIIVGAENGGFLRRVDRVTRAGDLVTLETSVAYLDEAVQEGAFAATILTDGEAVNTAPGATRFGPWRTVYEAADLTNTAAGLCCSLNGLTIGIKNGDGAGLPATISGEFTVKQGDIDFLPRLELRGEISRFRLQRFRAAIHGGLGLNLDVYELKLSGSVSTDKLTLKKESKTFLIQQKPFATFIGPMPVVGIITKTLKLQVTPTVSGGVVFEGKFRTGFGVTVGTEWIKDTGWRSLSQASSYFEATAPAFQGVEGTASVKIAVVPELSVQFYGVAGPKVDLEPYAEAAATAGLSFADGSPSGLDWETKVSLGLNLNVGAKISILGRIDLAEASFAIPIIKPYKLARNFSDGPLTIHATVTGEDAPAALSVRLRPGFTDTLPPFGRDLATSNQDLTVPVNQSVSLNSVRSGTAYPHVLTPINVPGNCTFGPPRNGDVKIAQFIEPADTVIVNSGAFIALGATPAVDTLALTCIRLGNLRVRTEVAGPDPTARNQLTLTRTSKLGSGKGSPPLTLSIPGGNAPPDTVVEGLVPANPDNGASGAYRVALEPGRRNCAVASPASKGTIITSGDTALAKFLVTCVALGHVRAQTTTTDPDALPPSAPVIYSVNVIERDDAGTVAATGTVASSTAAATLPASGTAVTGDLVPLYNASGSTGRHVVSLGDVPDRCRLAERPTQPVTVFPGDTAYADFVLHCVKRLHVAVTSTGPGTDQDGYLVTVTEPDGTVISTAIAPSDTVGIAGVQPGTVAIGLAGVDPGCITPASVKQSISARDSTLVSFNVSCPGPPAPSGLRATLVESTRIDLAWNPPPASARVASYIVYRARTGVPVPPVRSGSVPFADFSDTGLPAFTRFTYQVAAIDSSGVVGPLSAPLNVQTLDGTPPSAPGSLVATAVSDSRIVLSWQLASDRETGILHYNVYRDGVLIAKTTTNLYHDRGLLAATAYRYEVSAVNGAGIEGPRSAPAVATTLATPTTPHPGATGDLTVVVASRGEGEPATGYVVEVAAAGTVLTQPSATDDTLQFLGLVAQTYVVRVAGLPPQCTVNDGANPRSVVVTAGAVSTTTFDVVCK